MISSFIAPLPARFNVRLGITRPWAQTRMMSSERMLHAVYRVGNMERTGEFLQTLGMQKLRERDVPEEKYSNAFYGFGTESKGEHFSLELTYNYGVDSYDLGTGFGHFGVAVPDIFSAVERVRGAGFAVTREPGPVKGGTSVIAFVKDPTGYTFELLQRQQRDPLCQVMLRVSDLEKSISFYEGLGMQLLRTRKNEAFKYTLALMGYGSENDSTVLELTYNHGVDSYDPGNGYAQIAVSTPNVYDMANKMRSSGIAIAREPGPVPGIGTKICAVRDPDQWKIVFVDESDFEEEL